MKQVALTWLRKVGKFFVSGRENGTSEIHNPNIGSYPTPKSWAPALNILLEFTCMNLNSFADLCRTMSSAKHGSLQKDQPEKLSLEWNQQQSQWVLLLKLAITRYSNANHLQVCKLDFYCRVLFLNIVKAKEQASGFLYSCTHLWPYSYINQSLLRGFVWIGWANSSGLVGLNRWGWMEPVRGR